MPTQQEYVKDLADMSVDQLEGLLIESIGGATEQAVSLLSKTAQSRRVTSWTPQIVRDEIDMLKSRLEAFASAFEEYHKKQSKTVSSSS